MQKCFSETAQAGRSCHDESAHARSSLSRKNANNRLKDSKLAQTASFSDNSKLAPTSVQGLIWNKFASEPYNRQHLATHKLLKKKVKSRFSVQID